MEDNIYIEKESVKKMIQRLGGATKCEMIALLEFMPKVQIKTNEGEWLFKKITDDYHVTGQCSICKERRRIDNYCPSCGARMKGADDE